MSKIEPDTFYTIPEVCELSGLSRSLIYRAMQLGHLKFSQPTPARRRITGAAVLELLASSVPTRAGVNGFGHHSRHRKEIRAAE